MSETQLHNLVAFFESMYFDAYGYTVFEDGIRKYYLFRNREESFDKEKAIIVARYL